MRAADVHPPSIIVVGECVSRRETIAWFEKRPLFGRRIGITRPVAQAGPMIERVLQLGAEPVLLPTIQILPPDDWQPIDETLARFGEFDWLVFTSVNGVDGFMGRLWDSGGDARRLGRPHIAAIGPATGESLRRFRTPPRLDAPRIPSRVAGRGASASRCGQRVLWAKADRGRDVLPDELQKPEPCSSNSIVYRNVDEIFVAVDGTFTSGAG